MQDIVLISIPKSTIQNIVEQAVIKAITDCERIKNETTNIVVDLNGLIKARPFIGSRSTIYKKVSLGIIPHSKEGKKLYFSLKEIDEWLMSNKVKTIAQLGDEYKKR